MAVYSITYDLKKDKDYDRLERGVDQVSGSDWVKPTLSQYIIWSSYSAVEIRKALEHYIDNDDILLIVEIDTRNWAAQLLPAHISSRIIATNTL